MKFNLRTIEKKNKGKSLSLRRKLRIRKIVSGSNARPRLSVFKSAKHIYVQAIDDVLSVTLFSAGTLEASLQERVKGLKKVEAAKLVGEAIGEKLKSANIEAAVFDRNGFRYTGRIAALAEGVRGTGLKL